MTEIDYKLTDEIVCPYCGYEFSDSWEIDGDNQDIGLMECDECYKQFYATRNIEVSYSTRKAKYGTCECCGKDNIVIEDYTSSVGNYKDLYVTCGHIRRNQLYHKYMKEINKKLDS